MAELLTDAVHDDAQGAFVEATLTDALTPRRAMERLRARFPFAVSLRLEPATAAAPAQRRARVVRGRPLIEVCTDFVTDIRGTPPAPQEQALLVEALEASRSRDPEHGDGPGGESATDQVVA